MLTKSTILNAFLILLALATPLLAQDRPATDVQRDVLDQFLVRFDRISEQGFDHEKMNLFLKEPRWIDGLKSAERVHRYGYRDPNGRQAWYLSVTCKVNDAGLQLQVNEQCDSLTLLRHDQPIGNWSVETGTAFRVRKHQLEHLFAMQERVRPKADPR